MAVAPGRKAEQAALKASPEMPVAALFSTGPDRLTTEALPFPSHPVPLRKHITHPQRGESLPAPCGLSEGGGGKPLTRPAFCPDTAATAAVQQNSTLGLWVLCRCFLSFTALCFPLEDLQDPQEAPQKGKGVSLGSAGGFWRQQHKALVLLISL